MLKWHYVVQSSLGSLGNSSIKFIEKNEKFHHKRILKDYS